MAKTKEEINAKARERRAQGDNKEKANAKAREKYAKENGKLRVQEARNKIYADPIKHKEYKEKANIGHKKYREKVKLDPIRYAKMRKQGSAWQKNKDNTEAGRRCKVMSAYKCRDRKKGRFFDLTAEWMNKNIFCKPCVYCGETEKIGCDRINNKLGHEKKNVVPCCGRCNKTRQDLHTHEEMFLIGDLIRRIKEKKEEEKNGHSNNAGM